MNHQPYSTTDEAFLLPRLIRLEKNLYGAAFFLMKLLPARFILDSAEKEGHIHRGTTVIETTSGTFGLALAILCAQRGYNLILVSDPAIDDALKLRLEDLGTRVEIVRDPLPIGGFQGARLQRMAEIQNEHLNHFWPSQYNNPYNPGSYAPLAEMLVERLGKIDCLVGTIGSGGSMCGTTSYLRSVFPDLQSIGVDTFGSMLFGLPDQKRVLRGLGNSLMPKNLEHSVFNEIHWVSAAEAFLATRMLHKINALYMGGTSGAAYLVGRWWAQQNPDANVVVLLPDEGYRYQETIYNDEWLCRNNVWLSELPSEPKLIVHPLEADSTWSRIQWKRRSYEQVVDSSIQLKTLL
ncbi:MAG: cysteine synthase family protein [Rhizonema sp. PD37]|nr:cysteine synthase family protein [Rhizonema sp. PD37]